MLEFLIIAKDKPNSVEIRKANRDAHLAFLQSGICQVKLAGPLLENDIMVGSVIVVVAESLAKVQQFVQLDPYAKAGLLLKVTIQSMKIVIDE